jgi:hypothetical protein
MASQSALSALRTTADAFARIDESRLLSENLDDALPEVPLKPTLDQLKRKLDFVLHYAPLVHDSYVDHAQQHFQAALNDLNEGVQLANSAEDVATKQTLLNRLNASIEAVNVHWAPFVAAAVESRGFLEDEGIRRHYERTITQMHIAARAALADVRKELAAAIEEARKLPEQIEPRELKTPTTLARAAEMQFGLVVIVCAVLAVAALVLIARLLL